MHMQMSICRHSIWFGIQLQKKKTKCWNIPNRKTTITSKRQNKKSSFLVLTKKPVQRTIHYKSIWKVHNLHIDKENSLVVAFYIMLYHPRAGWVQEKFTKAKLINIHVHEILWSEPKKKWIIMMRGVASPDKEGDDCFRNFSQKN